MPLRPAPDLVGYNDIGSVLLHPIHKSTYSSPPNTSCTDVRGCGTKEYRKTSATWGLYQEANCQIVLLGVISLRVMNLRQNLTLPSGAVVNKLDSGEIKGFVTFMMNNLSAAWDVVCPNP